MPRKHELFEFPQELTIKFKIARQRPSVGMIVVSVNIVVVFMENNKLNWKKLTDNMMNAFYLGEILETLLGQNILNWKGNWNETEEFRTLEVPNEVKEPQKRWVP